uniref:CSON014569 protein n=1 Tax=Culicoides sonorensis TaxID=179676 RepID=A0A336MGM5_CULSO
MALLQNLLTLGLISTVLVNMCDGGPAGQIALAAARASKIPRSIRASFRNPELGVARGFGKRSQQTSSKSITSMNLLNYCFFPFLTVSTNENKFERTLRRARFKLNDHEPRISRGFGKRSVSSVSNDLPWSYSRKEDLKWLDDMEQQEHDPFQQLLKEMPEAIPIDWLSTEMANNPYLARAILRRVVDLNRDGYLTALELMPPVQVVDSNVDSY